MDDIEIRIHEEIDDYKERFKGFTVRQWISVILIFGINTPLYYFAHMYINGEVTDWLVILIAGVLGFIGFIKIQGLNAERILPYIWRYYTRFARALPYKTAEQIAWEKEQKAAERKKRIEQHRLFPILRFFKKMKEMITHGIQSIRHKKQTKSANETKGS